MLIMKLIILILTSPITFIPTMKPVWLAMLSEYQGYRLLSRTGGNKPRAFEHMPQDFRIVDGDTIALGQHRIRLWGINAPEKGTVGLAPNGVTLDLGVASGIALSRMIEAAGKITIVPMDADQYDRTVARTYADDEIDLCRDLVRHGWAVPYGRWGWDAYRLEHESARRAGRGIHAFELLSAQAA